jgi:uracil-DNA glycosylase family 4
MPRSVVYITNILPWRPPQNRDPTPDEIAMLHALRAAARRTGGPTC